MRSTSPRRNRSHGCAFSSPRSCACSYQVDEHRAGTLVRIDPLPVLGDGDEWLVEDAPVRRGVLECRSALGRRPRGGPTQQHLRREPGHEHVRGKRIVADLQGESQGHAGVPKHLVQSLEHPDTARGDALVGDCERLAIALRLRHHLGEELVRLLRRLVESDTRQNHGGSGSLRTGIQRGDHVTQLRLGSP